MSLEYTHDHEKEITLFGKVNFRNADRKFGIRTDDRRRHMYIIGKTGMGKTTLMSNMILSDIYAGHGICYIDPHGDEAEKLIDFIPPERINDVVYFNPADTAFPFGFNILENPSDDRKHLVRDGLMGVFKKIWPDVWSARMEYILQNCVSALLDYPGATLMGINRLLVDKDYREKVIDKIRDPVVKTFWVAEFSAWSEKYATEAIAPVQNKVGQFLSSSLIRNIVAQTRSTIDIRKIMDEGKILMVNLSKGRVGEDGMRLLGGMLVTKIQLSAQERQNQKEHERRDFYLYVDEFQNFANESFATILSEARKYRLNLIVAHQYMAQLEEPVQEAVLGNVGTMVAMRVGPQDAELLETEFTPTFLPEDLVNLAKFQMYLKLMVDGVATQPFSANTLPPIANRTGSEAKVIQASRERYSEPRHVIEQKVLKWTGMELVHGATTLSVDTEEKESVEELALSSPSPTLAVLKYPTIQTEEEREQEERDVVASAGEGAVTPPRLVIRPERLAAIEDSIKLAKAAEKTKKKPSFAHICQRCGKSFELAVQLDPSKPIYDPECRDLLKKEREERQARGGGARRPLSIGGGRSSGSDASSGAERPRGDRPPRSDRPRQDGGRSGGGSSNRDRGSLPPRSDGERSGPRPPQGKRLDIPREALESSAADRHRVEPSSTAQEVAPPSPPSTSIHGSLAPGESLKLD